MQRLFQQSNIKPYFKIHFYNENMYRHMRCIMNVKFIWLNAFFPLYPESLRHDSSTKIFCKIPFYYIFFFFLFCHNRKNCVWMKHIYTYIFRNIYDDTCDFMLLYLMFTVQKHKHKFQASTSLTLINVKAFVMKLVSLKITYGM